MGKSTAMDIDRLQGAWSIVAIEMDGRKMPGGGAQIVVRGKRFTTSAMGATYQGTMAVDQTASPKSFDLHFEEGPEKGNTSLGIYKLDGDAWTICLTTRGAERPKEFAAPAGTGIALETLTRGTAAAESTAAADSDEMNNPVGEPAAELGGEWSMVSMVRDGVPLESSMVKFCRRIATASQITVKAGPQTIIKATYTVDRSPTPMTMDYVYADGKRQHGLWALEGDLLTTCFGAPGQPRPTEFASIKGDGRTFTVWRR
jgi:uncharacterized protein (TIGR03067 family)